MEGIHGGAGPAATIEAPASTVVHRAPRRKAPGMRDFPPSEFEIDKLRREHELGQFDCGNPALSGWLQRFAWTNQQADSAKTYVMLDGRRVVGYYALATGAVDKHESPERVAKGLANHPIGIVLLAR